MSQALLSLRSAPSNVWHLRRKKVPDELSLPADYVPTDYTSLPPEEPKKRGVNPIALGVLLLFVIGAIAAAYFLIPKNTKDEEPAAPKTELTFERARMIVSDNKLTTQIDAAVANAPDGSVVTATMLENDIPFDFFDAKKITETVTAGKVNFSIPENDTHDNGRKSSKYTVKLTVTRPDKDVAEFTSEPLEINATALTRFLGEDQANTDEPTPTTISEPTAVTEPPTAAPTAEPTAPAIGQLLPPLENVVISRPGIVYTTPYGPAVRRGDVVQGQLATLVVKLPVGADVWYLAVVPATGTAGWVNSNVIDLPASETNKISSATGESPYAVVFNGGNVRSAPGGAVVTQVNAGQNVKLIGRLGDNSWFNIETASGNGWVSAALLTVNPSVVDTIPVAP
jgi:restriction system protein